MLTKACSCNWHVSHEQSKYDCASILSTSTLVHVWFTFILNDNVTNATMLAMEHAHVVGLVLERKWNP